MTNRNLLALALGLSLFSFPAAADQVSYKIKHANSDWRLWHHGILAVNDGGVNYSEPKGPHSFSMSCEAFRLASKMFKPTLGHRVLEVQLPWGEDALYPDEKDLTADTLYKGINDECDAQAERAKSNAAQAAVARAAENEKRRLADAESAEAQKRLEEERRLQKEVAFRDGLLAALRAAEEPDAFASIRGDFDLSGSDNRQWKTNLQVPDAEKCALLKTAAPNPTAASAWTFACIFRTSGDGYERMVKSVQSVLHLPYEPDERATTVNQVFFADPSKPAWRVFIAKTNNATVGVSVVAVRFAGAPITVANTTPFPVVATMLPADSTVGGDVVRSSQVGQAATSDAQCEAYKRQEGERVSRDQEIRRLESELRDLQMRSQEATRQAMESERLQNANSVNALGGGPLAGLATAGSVAAGLAAQQHRSEAQNLEAQINLKQTQITTTQISASSLARAASPPACGENRTPRRNGVSEPIVREEVEKIRNGRYSPLPPAQRANASAPMVLGRTTMMVRNSTAYELSVYFDGPISTKLTLMPGDSQDLDLAPGGFYVAGRIAAPNVLPFYGEETYASSARYSLTFYVAPSTE